MRKLLRETKRPDVIDILLLGIFGYLLAIFGIVAMIASVPLLLIAISIGLVIVAGSFFLHTWYRQRILMLILSVGISMFVVEVVLETSNDHTPGRPPRNVDLADKIEGFDTRTR